MLRRRRASTAPLGIRHSPSHPITRTRRYSRPAGRCSGCRLPPSRALVSRAWASSTFDWVSATSTGSVPVHFTATNKKRLFALDRCVRRSWDHTACGPRVWSPGPPHTHTQHRAPGRLATCCWMLTGSGTFLLCSDVLDEPVIRKHGQTRATLFLISVDSCRVSVRAARDRLPVQDALGSEPPPSSCPHKWTVIFSCPRTKPANNGPSGGHSPFARAFLDGQSGVFAEGLALKSAT